MSLAMLPKASGSISATSSGIAHRTSVMPSSVWGCGVTFSVPGLGFMAYHWVTFILSDF
jgi:hypothetical protein